MENFFFKSVLQVNPSKEIYDFIRGSHYIGYVSERAELLFHMNYLSRYIYGCILQETKCCMGIFGKILCIKMVLILPRRIWQISLIAFQRILLFNTSKTDLLLSSFASWALTKLWIKFKTWGWLRASFKDKFSLIIFLFFR